MVGWLVGVACMQKTNDEKYYGIDQQFNKMKRELRPYNDNKPTQSINHK